MTPLKIPILNGCWPSITCLHKDHCRNGSLLRPTAPNQSLHRHPQAITQPLQTRRVVQEVLCTAPEANLVSCKISTRRLPHQIKSHTRNITTAQARICHQIMHVEEINFETSSGHRLPVLRHVLGTVEIERGLIVHITIVEGVILEEAKEAQRIRMLCIGHIRKVVMSGTLEGILKDTVLGIDGIIIPVDDTTLHFLG